MAASDGLRLHARQYGLHTAPGIPVVCLPGLSRTIADFDALAPALATGSGLFRRVIAIDLRGRGLSDYDSNPKNYNLAVELADIVTVLTALEVDPAIFIGSSRGGILTMLMGVAHPGALAGVVLHDIGPVIEPMGLARIKSYLGKYRSRAHSRKAPKSSSACSPRNFPSSRRSNGALRHTEPGGCGAAKSSRLTISGLPIPLRISTSSGRCLRFGMSSIRFRNCRCWLSAALIPTFCQKRRSVPWLHVIPVCSPSRCRMRGMFQPRGHVVTGISQFVAARDT